MNVLVNTRVISDKTTNLLRSLISNRVTSNITETLKKAQHTAAEEKDAPVDIPNPYQKERIECLLCKHKIEPDYKNVRLLSQFQSRFTGRIYGRHITGLCEAKQKKVEAEIKKAQNAGLMPIYHKNIKYANDPKIFDIDNPFRPHKY